MASSLICGAAFFGAEVLRDAGFLRGDLAFLAAGCAASPFNAVSSDGAFDLSVSFPFRDYLHSTFCLFKKIKFFTIFFLVDLLGT